MPNGQPVLFTLLSPAVAAAVAVAVTVAVAFAVAVAKFYQRRQIY